MAKPVDTAVINHEMGCMANQLQYGHKIWLLLSCLQELKTILIDLFWNLVIEFFCLPNIISWYI